MLESLKGNFFQHQSPCELMPNLKTLIVSNSFLTTSHYDLSKCESLGHLDLAAETKHSLRLPERQLQFKKLHLVNINTLSIKNRITHKPEEINPNLTLNRFSCIGCSVELNSKQYYNIEINKFECNSPPCEVIINSPQITHLTIKDTPSIELIVRGQCSIKNITIESSIQNESIKNLEKCFRSETNEIKLRDTTLQNFSFRSPQNLKRLELSFNSLLKNFELSKAPKLESLNLTSNALEEFNLNMLKGFPELQKISYLENERARLISTENYVPEKLKVAIFTSQNPDTNRPAQTLGIMGETFNLFIDPIKNLKKMRAINSGLYVYAWGNL